MSQSFLRSVFALILIFGHLNVPEPSPWIPDNFPGVAVFVLPLVRDLDIGEATLQPDEPQHCSPTDRTVWYGFIPSGPITVTVDTRGSTNTNISLYRDANDSGTFADLEFMGCTSGEPVTVSLEPGKRYSIQVGAIAGESSTVKFSLSDVLAISGRIIDAITGVPLPGYEWPYVWVTMHKVCGEGCLQEIGSVPADPEGRFWFQDYSMWGIEPGGYVFQATATSYLTAQFGPFEFGGGSLDVGDLALDPLSTIKSIRGRLLDQVTGRPIPRTFAPVVSLYRCTEGGCSELVNSQNPKSDGRFHFETDSGGNSLPVGIYQIRALADQYYSIDTQTFEVKAGKGHNTGNVRIRSYPIRFSDLVHCDTIPVSGGECEYSMRVWNGLGGKFEGKVWSMAELYLNDLLALHFFQVKEPQKLVLGRGKSKVIHFRLKVPAHNEAPYARLCLNALAGRGRNSFMNTVAMEFLFCVERTQEGFVPAPRLDADVQAQISVKNAAHLADIEPNNSCQEAQRVGAVTLPFSTDGYLSSPAMPDVDFYRFRGTPGQSIAIIHEGQPEKGTLESPLLGVFDSGCNLIVAHDDGSLGNTRMDIKVPVDGIFFIAATSYPDWDFTGAGIGGGTYHLTVMDFSANASISGRVIDALSGEPLSGRGSDLAFATLLQCDSDNECFILNMQPVGDDGHFYFAGDYGNYPLAPGNYALIFTGYQYEPLQIEQFALNDNQHIDLGDIALTPYPIFFSAEKVCEVPSQGGVCEYSVKLTNPRDTPFSGKVWSVIDAWDTGSFINSTLFQANTPLNIRLKPGASRTMRFRFRVPGTVPDGAGFCLHTFVGENPAALFKQSGRGFFYCLLKGPEGFSWMSQEDAQKKILQMQMQRLPPKQPFSDITK